MPVCSYKKKKHRKICIGDMQDEITIQSRSLTPPLNSSVDFSETFTGKATVWSLVETANGQTIFDATNTERDVTHNIYIRFLSGITSEDWILFNGQRIDILDVQNFEERNEFMVLKCSNRGTSANIANEL